MFAVYGTSGQIFVGPLEEMRRVVPLRRAAAIRAHDGQFDRALDAALAPYVQHPPAQPGAHAPAQRLGLAATHSGGAEALHAYGMVQRAPQDGRQPLQRVGEVMTHRPLCLRAGYSLREAWRQLAEAGYGQAPVTNSDGILVGLLTRAELLQPERLPHPDQNPVEWHASWAQPVSSWMLSPVPSVDEHTDLRRLAEVMLETALPGLPVVDARGHVDGFVSRTDVLRAIIHDPPLDLWS